MRKFSKRVLAVTLSTAMVFSLAACNKSNNNPTDSTTSQSQTGESTSATDGSGETGNDGVPTYTYNSYTSALANNWNPHTWESNADDNVLNGYLSSPFCTMQILDSENGVYQWVYEMATSITDVTKDHKDDLTKYNVTLPSGKTADETDAGFVFEIKLNPDAKWQDGTAITADTYVYSMQQLLDSSMKNYRANLYYSGESAVAGGLAYYNSESPLYNAMVPAYGDGETPDYSYDLDAGIDAGYVYISDSADTTLGYSVSALWNDYSLGTEDGYAAITDGADDYGYTKVTADNKDAIFGFISAALAGGFGITDEAELADLTKEMLFVNDGTLSEKVDWDTVGLYKVDDYTIRYVTQTYQDLNYFLTSCTSTWLVYEPYYEAGKDTTGTLVTTDYNTKLENTMSYGPYKLVSLQNDKQMVFEKNENWYGYTEENGRLVSTTPYLVDGENVPRYVTDKIVINVMDDNAAKQAFLKGEIDGWSPSADDLSTYATSDQLYKVDETYTMSFFFNTNLEKLQEMDRSKGNTNSVVLSNDNFRKAMSLGIDRTEWVTATPGYKPAYAILNNLYFYDVYNDPTSSYRNSDEAMQAICNLYGVAYGDGTPYATLQDAYKSINGYNLTEAKELMKTACDELVAAGLYTAGEDIVIRIGYKKGALDSSDNKQIELFNKYVNAAAEGSGFGKITLTAVDNINDRYGDVVKGEYAIGYGAWGGAAFYPFRNFQVYCDPDQYSINEAGCWDPATEELTLNVNGEDVTMTWKAWSGSMIGSGVYSEADFSTKLSITAQLEENFLKKYYRIPLAGMTSCSMLSYKCSYYTEDYNIMYGFGGMELMKYNYSDQEWADYIANNTLSYE